MEQGIVLGLGCDIRSRVDLLRVDDQGLSIESKGLKAFFRGRVGGGDKYSDS